MKILVIDIETSPNLAHVWGLWKQNIHGAQLIYPTQMMCFAAKWYGKDAVLFRSTFHHSKEEMLDDLWGLLDGADAVIHYNGIRFDIPHINREFLLSGRRPYSPIKQIDLLRTSKGQFRFPSNKLDSISKDLGIGKKIETAGHQMWVDCMNGDGSAWDRMKEYNIEDVKLTEQLYSVYKPWIKGHPNAGLYNSDEVDEIKCPRCGRDNIRKQGFAYTNVSKFQQYQCKKCGSWFRGRKNLASGEKVGMNV